MKTIEINTWTSLLLACIVAGVGSILPSFFNLAGYMSGLVYTVVAVVILTTYRRKLWFRINNVNTDTKVEIVQSKPDTEDKIRKLKEMNDVERI